MKKVTLLLLLLLFASIGFAQTTANKTYHVKYVLDSRGNAQRSEATVYITRDRITVQRNGYEKYWDVKFLGTFNLKESGESIPYDMYYLVNKKVNFTISVNKTINYNGTYYYHINFDGQGQLAL
ncbi:hypothetical protein M2459_002718 [Parabacteroides sp. PF5-5]|uniref:hypothetical protein n=1 Tax=unclassified Parabacteroides TaxID=2649774 RepID=UPI0024736BB4|nr:MULTISPECIES: hypothetical protein [unclassified Parabacteroides]MDH6305931.1 hypothetical protein [Parabacteroides sp. PH5-39]MDH6316854.1 hypothetical protein [Parabacteroides sp. PF5-13]MDH6320643.1 hypothetical protein [Parabacteroides sp. PH5-13]MDH6324436.1 hypothetical protein [Parabacteroides sp. PH5-8]MDH6328039.1 hypothetical protein [Parabacteroides sp. PH5-41]